MIPLKKKYFFLTLVAAIVLVSFFVFHVRSQYDKIPFKTRQALGSIPKNKEVLDLLMKYRNNKSDSLKFRALCFLLENMNEKYFFTGEQIQCLNTFFFKVEELQKKNGVFPEPVKIAQLWDSTEQHCATTIAGLDPILDEQEIDSTFLRTVVENSFDCWRKVPYTSNLTFENFLEYVLPYRSGDEKLEDNYQYIKDKYDWLVDSINGRNDPVEACRLINNDLKSWFTFHYKLQKYPTDISISNLFKGKVGTCRDMANLTCVTMRTLGVPTAVDFAAQWGNREEGHVWNVVFDKDMHAWPFMGTESNPGENSSYFERSVPAKVYRRTYSSQYYIDDESGNVPLFFRSSGKKDVTSLYAPVSDVSVQLVDNRDFADKYAYLCVFSTKGWNPIAVAAVNRQDEEVVFRDVGRGVIYLPAAYHKNEIFPLGDPFLITDSGAKIILKPKKESVLKVKLDRKFPLYSHIVQFAERMIGGKFQGSNDSSFLNAEDLYVISGKPQLHFQDVTVKCKRPYKYLRYLSPHDGYGDVAEIQFFNGPEKVKGETIGMSKWNIRGDAFDENIDTFFASAEAGAGEWLGIKLPVPKNVTMIRFLPRNDNNYIRKGDLHELFYWNNEWVSLGKKRADDYSITYNNVPDNAVLWIRNLDYGVEERIFLVKNGKQEWW